MLSGLYCGQIMAKYAAFNDYKTRITDMVMMFSAVPQNGLQYILNGYRERETLAIASKLHLMGHKKASESVQEIHSVVFKHFQEIKSNPSNMFSATGAMSKCFELTLNIKPSMSVFIKFWKTI